MSSAPSLRPPPWPMLPIDSVHEVVGLGLGTLHLSGPPWSALGKAEQMVLSLLTWNPPRPPFWRSWGFFCSSSGRLGGGWVGGQEPTVQAWL